MDNNCATYIGKHTKKNIFIDSLLKQKNQYNLYLIKFKNKHSLYLSNETDNYCAKLKAI